MIILKVEVITVEQLSPHLKWVVKKKSKNSSSFYFQYTTAP